jgi:hypothetical protein
MGNIVTVGQWLSDNAAMLAHLQADRPLFLETAFSGTAIEKRYHLTVNDEPQKSVISFSRSMFQHRMALSGVQMCGSDGEGNIFNNRHSVFVVTKSSETNKAFVVWFG